MNFMVFGILNTIGEFFAFVMMCFVSLIGAAVTVAANEAGGDVDGGGLALPITFTILLLAHAICTIIMVSINTIYSERLQNLAWIWKNGQNGRHGAGWPFLPFRAILWSRAGYRDGK